MKISVIMPTLNAGRHIEKTLDSLAAQTFKDAELLVIDSRSSDNTAEAVQAHHLGGMPAKIFFMPECTPGMARNIGIENAAGEYIAFCDADDLMKPDMLELLYAAVQRQAFDIAVCDFDMVYPDRKIEHFASLADGTHLFPQDNPVNYYYRFCAAPKPNNYVWSRLYKRSFLIGNHIRFMQTRYSEDHLFNLAALLKAPNITHIGRSLYCYMQHDNSAMRKHIRQSNHGRLFLDSLYKAAETLRGQTEDVASPILAIYAYTRIKSILFYAWQARLPEAETKAAVSAFASDALAKEYLSMCLDRDYIARYSRLHERTAEWEQTVRDMLRACIGDEPMPSDMREAFA